MSDKGRFNCEVEGCPAGVDTGDAIYRTSPMGGPFRGRCRKHFTEPIPEPDVARIIEEHNLGPAR